MAAAEESLDQLLHRATHPSGPNVDWKTINAFADRVSESQDGIPTALRLLVHRIQSSDEQEALNGLLALDVCSERCGQCFQDEIGKFRFLNELIKLVSPKYLGSRTSPLVKKKVIEILYNWTQVLKNQPKIKDAYEMLKWQKVVIEDPIPEPPPPPRPKNTIFEDEEKSKMLQKLLHSSNRDDLLAANRLIKTMVKEEEKRTETVMRRCTELETVRNNVKVLSDMLLTYRPHNTSSDEVELMKELYQTCERLRPGLFRLATDTDDKDDGLADILKANDELMRVVEQYQRIMGTEPGTTTNPPTSNTNTSLPNQNNSDNVTLLDLGTPDAEKSKAHAQQDLLDSSLLANDDALLGSSFSQSVMEQQHHHHQQQQQQGQQTHQDDLTELGDIFSSISPIPPMASTFGPTKASLLTPERTTKGDSSFHVEASKHPEIANSEDKKWSKGLEDLDALGIALLKQALPPNTPLGVEFHKPPEKLPMNQMKKSTAVIAPSLQSLSDPNSTKLSEGTGVISEPSSVSDLFVPLESIQPGNISPLLIYNKNAIDVVIHFGKDCPKPGVHVMVVTTLNKNPDPITSYSFQATVDKNARLKLQPPSATKIAPYNPILPPPAITQVMLLSKPDKEKTILKYKIVYIMKDEANMDVGEVDNLPLT